VLEEVLAHNSKLQIEARDLKARENMKNSLRQRLEYQTQAIASQEEDDRIVEQLLSRSKFAAPESLVTERAIELLRRELMNTPDIKTKNEAEQKKITTELFEKIKPRAEKEVKASFVLAEVAKREKVEVSEEDADKRIEILAKMAGREKEKFAAGINAEQREELKGQIRIERTLTLLKKRSLLIKKPIIIKA
jgi:trigger factor